MAEGDGRGGGGNRKVAAVAHSRAAGCDGAARELFLAEAAAWREARRNFAVMSNELRAALRVMGKSKTGRTLAVEQLENLDDELLKPWLEVTGMFFIGEMVDEMRTGTVTPLPKDELRFRPITLLEPIYKCCMATMAGRLLHALHEFGLLDAAQFGFVVDGSCIEPLTIMVRIFEQGRAARKARKCTWPSWTRRQHSTQCHTRRSTRRCNG